MTDSPEQRVTIDGVVYVVTHDGQTSLELRPQNGTADLLQPELHHRVPQRFHTLLQRGSITIMITSFAKEGHPPHLLRSTLRDGEPEGMEFFRKKHFVCEVFRSEDGVGIIVTRGSTYQLLWFRIFQTQADRWVSRRIFTLEGVLWDPEGHSVVCENASEVTIRHKQTRIAYFTWRDNTFS